MSAIEHVRYVNKSRFKYDYDLRASLGDGRVVHSVSPFWNYVAAIHGASTTKGRAVCRSSYKFNEPACVAFSGGLESMLLAATVSNLPLVAFDPVPRVADVLSVTAVDAWLPGPNIEGDIAVVTAGMGYATVLIGTEHTSDCPETSATFENEWAIYSGQRIISPLRGLYKDEIALALWRTRPDLYVRVLSCTKRRDGHCGGCTKCLVLMHVSRAIGHPLPIEPTRDLTDDAAWVSTLRRRLHAEYDYVF